VQRGKRNLLECGDPNLYTETSVEGVPIEAMKTLRSRGLPIRREVRNFLQAAARGARRTMKEADLSIAKG